MLGMSNDAGTSTGIGKRVVQVQVAHDDRAALQQIIDALVAERLIACGQLLGPIDSTFCWDGAVQHAQEWLALLKTGGERVPQLLARIAELHSYEVPEVLVLDVSDGHQPYLHWVTQRTCDSHI
jgi:periplasmic divalent cation tolerance protein